MSALSKTQIAYLPSGEGSHVILNLPNSRTSQPQNFLLHNEQLYELLQVSSLNPHLSSHQQPPTTKGDNKPVRSLILENLTSKDEGLILENSEFIISTKYNLEFSLIWWFNIKERKQAERFQTIDDLIDSIEADIPEITKLPIGIISKSLRKTCQVLNENDQEFFKYSETTVNQLLKNKIEKIVENFPKSIVEKSVKPSLYPVDISKPIPNNILQLSQKQHAIHLLSSYLLPKVSSNLIKEYNFEELDEYLNTLKQDKIKRKLVEDSVNDLNQLNSQNKRKSNGTTGPTSKKKQPIKKGVKVQKGALDIFFKKK